MTSILKRIALIVCGLAPLMGFALETPGYPWVEVYTDPHLFENTPTVFRIIQTADGLLLVGNEAGLFTFDGRRWRSLNIPDLRDIVGLVKDLDGRIIVGTYQQPGYLAPRAEGQLQFISLSSLLPKADAEQRVFANPVVGRDGVYFTSFNRVFRWDRSQHIDVWPTTDLFANVFALEGEVFISDGRQRLYRVQGTALEPVPGSDVVPLPSHAQAQKITDAVRYRNGWLMSTEADGFRFFDGHKVEPIELPGSKTLRDAPGLIVTLRALGEGRFVAGDNQSNIFFFDANGEISGRWGPRDFPGFTTSGLFVDESHSLWTAVSNGVLRMDSSRAIRVFDQRAQWKASSDQVFAQGDKRWFNAGEQTFEWVQGNFSGTGSVRPAEGIVSLHGIFDGDLIYVPKRGADVLCKYADGRIETLLPGGSWHFHGSDRRGDTLYLEEEPNKVSLMRKLEGRWQPVGPAVTLPVEFSDVVEGDAHLWFSAGEGRVVRGNLEPFLENMTLFDASHGLPSQWIRPFNLGREVLFASRGEIYHFDEVTKKFSPDPRFAHIPDKSSQDFRAVATDPEGNIWIGSSGSGILRLQPDGSYKWDGATLAALGTLQVRHMQWDPAGWMWCQTAASMFAIRSDTGGQNQAPLQVHLGEVRDLRADRPLFGLYRPARRVVPPLPYAQNALQFEVVAPDFIAPGAVEFQFKLQGSDERWSAWAKSPVRRYPNLGEGDYTFRYRARNVHGAVAEGAPFDFSIQAPFYRTFPAYLAYLLVGCGGIWGGSRLYSRRLRQHNVHLEEIVTKRTLDLQKAQRDLIDASHQAGMAEVATSVLHNVGNVLNSVNVSAGVIAQNARRVEAEKLAKLATLLNEHEDHLGEYLTQDSRGKLVPQFLQLLAKQVAVERDTLLKETASLQSNIDHIKEIVAMQQAHASPDVAFEALDPVVLMEDSLRLNGDNLDHHQIKLVKQFNSVPAVTGQRAKILQILVNLLRNAKRACDDRPGPGRAILLRLETTAPGRVRLIVEDNGVGIPPGNLSRIFNHGFTTRKDGHGFGLHAAANAAREMQGSLTVESKGPGCGATFTLELPAAVEAGSTGADTSRPAA